MPSYQHNDSPIGPTSPTPLAFCRAIELVVAERGSCSVRQVRDKLGLSSVRATQKGLYYLRAEGLADWTGAHASIHLSERGRRLLRRSRGEGPRAEPPVAGSV